MKDPISIAGKSVKPGEQQVINVKLPDLYSHSEVSMPVHVINGRRPGPVLFLNAAIHGDELNGVEIIRRVLRRRAVQKLKGTLIAVPVVNVYGFLIQSRYLPDRRDLNRTFPGSEKGSIAARVAHIFMSEIVAKCTHGIDLHTGAINRENLPQIRANVLDDATTREMANSFGVPVILNSALRDGSLRGEVLVHGIPVLLYEAGEALRFDEVAIRIGVRGILNTMRYLEMIPGKPMVATKSRARLAASKKWIRASHSGIFRAQMPLGTLVKKGQSIGFIADFLGRAETAVLAEFDGIVIGKTNLPLVYEGDALFHIAAFSSPERVEKSLEALQNEFDPESSDDRFEVPPIV